MGSGIRTQAGSIETGSPIVYSLAESVRNCSGFGGCSPDATAKENKSFHKSSTPCVKSENVPDIVQVSRYAKVQKLPSQKLIGKTL